MAADNTAGDTPATPIKRIPAYMLPKKPTHRKAQLLLKSTESSRLQASRSVESQLEVSVDESSSANGEKEEQPSCDKVLPPKVRQYACQVYGSLMLIRFRPSSISSPIRCVSYTLHRKNADIVAGHVGQDIHGWRTGGDIDWSVEQLPIKGLHYMLEGESWCPTLLWLIS